MSYPWQVIAVASCVDETHDQCRHGVETGAAPFAYTVGLEPLVGYELWVSTQGTCRHNVSYQGACWALNELGERLVADPSSREVPLDFSSGSTLTFTAGLPLADRRELLQTFMAGESPVAVVEWTCCP